MHLNKNFILLSLASIVGAFLIVSTYISYSQPQTPITATSLTRLSTTTPAVSEATSTSTVQVATYPTTPAPLQTKPTPSNNASQPISTSTPPPTLPTTPASIPDFAAINTTARAAVVNIICTTKVNGSLDPITATGVIIDPRGIILTNAHVGQYWLLQNFQVPDFVTCQIRTGSPAQPKYNAELLYISPTWVQKNKTLLTEINPQGTGEDDFALLRITDTMDGTPLPTFPYLQPDTRETVTINETVDLVSYPAGFLGGQSILQDLDLTSALTNIQQIFTFDTTTVDLISVGGTVVSQKGASGGAVVDRDATLIGIISTESDAPTTADRDLRAITLAHISRTLKNEIGQTLPQFLATPDLAAFAHNFQTTTAPILSKMIEDELLK